MTRKIHLLTFQLLMGLCCVLIATQIRANAVFVNVTLKVSETSLLSKTTDLNIDSDVLTSLLSQLQQNNQTQTLVLPADPNQNIYLKQQPDDILPLGNTTTARLTVKNASASGMLSISLPDHSIEVFDPSGRSPLKFLLYDFNQYEIKNTDGEHSFNIGASLVASKADNQKTPFTNAVFESSTSFVGRFNVEINY